MRKALPYLLLAPAVIYLLLVTFYPGVYIIWRSFYEGRFKLEYVGLQNYERLFSESTFWESLYNTALIGSISLSIQFVIALTLAALVYRDPWVKGWRIVFLLPMLFMPSAVAFLWKLLFNDGRVISDLLGRIGVIEWGTFVDFMASAGLARTVLIVADVWQWTPFLFIIFVAALQGQDKEVEEAARLDGASWTQIFFALSLPMMKPVIAIALILRGVDIVALFSSVQIITWGTPGGATQTVSYFIYDVGRRQFDIGYASAASVVMLVITIVAAQILVRRFFASGRA